jgi:hypothetical protein
VITVIVAGAMMESGASLSRLLPRIPMPLLLIGLVLSIYAIEFVTFSRFQINSALKDSWYADLHELPLGEVLKLRIMVITANLPLPPQPFLRVMLKAVIFTVILLGSYLQVRYRLRSRQTIVWLYCVTACATMMTANLLGLYPIARGTSLFLLPTLCVLLVLCCEAIHERAAQRLCDKRALQYALAAVWMVLLLTDAGPVLAAHLAPPAPIEDYDAAFNMLRAQTQPADLVFLHASVREAADLYLHIGGRLPAPVIYGNTGWPCCTRNWQHPSTESPGMVANDLLRQVPPRFAGRLWLFYTSRPEHYSGYSFDPREAMAQALAASGCRASSGAEFTGVVLRAFDCHPDG